MRVAFMGTPAFAIPTLTALAEAGCDIAAVYTQPPRPAGRGKNLRPTPVAEAAATLGAPVRTPQSFKDPATCADFRELRADVAVVVAYGLLLPQGVLDAPRFGCLNLHASLLPRWRGAAPIQRAVMAGDSETGVCVMRMTLGLDEGPVLARRTTPIGPEDTSGALFERLAELGAPLVRDVVEAMGRGEAPKATPQPSDGVIYARKVDKAEARIDWAHPASVLDQLIRGVSPAPGAWCETGAGDRLKVLLAAPVSGADVAGDPGALAADGVTVGCGVDALRLISVQRAGKSVSDAAAAARAGVFGARLR